jgi:hypothetical protein
MFDLTPKKKHDDEIADKYYSIAEGKEDELAQEIAKENGRDDPTEEDRNKAKVQLGMSQEIEVGGETIPGVMSGMEEEIKNRPGENSLVRMMQVGSRSSPNQIRQLMGTTGMVKDVHKQRIPKSIKSSLNRRLKGGEYYLQQHGALMGLRDRSVETSKPGYLGKQIIAGASDMIVTEKDCGTTTGKEIPLRKDGNLNTKDLQGRYLAETGEQVTGPMLSEMDRQGKDALEVRSPLTCEAEQGVCQKCYGLSENGNMPDLGENVGVREGQGIIEASTKLTLKSFHNCLDRRTTVPVRQDGEVRLPTLKELWEEQSTEVVASDSGRQVERRFDVETEIWDNGEWTTARRLIRHPQKEDTKMVFMRTREGQFIIGQDDHPSMLSESQSLCPECGKTLRFTSSGKTRFCREGCVSGISVEDVPKAEEVRPRDIEDKSHLAHVDEITEGASATPPIKDGWLAGMFVAEGSVRHVKETWEPTGTTNVYARSVMWSQNQGELRDHIEEVAESVHGGDHGTPHSSSSNGDSVVIDSTDLAEQYEVFGRGAQNKGLPGEFIGYGDEWLADFLAGVLDGDGTEKHAKRGDSLNLDTTSPLLVRQVMIIGKRLGIKTNVCLAPNKEHTVHQCFRVQFENSPALEAITSRTERFDNFPIKDEVSSDWNEPNLVDYVRPIQTKADRPMVYDIETESHTLTANGIWTHNTGSAD